MLHRSGLCRGAVAEGAQANYSSPRSHTVLRLSRSARGPTFLLRDDHGHFTYDEESVHSTSDLSRGIAPILRNESRIISARSIGLRWASSVVLAALLVSGFGPSRTTWWRDCGCP